MQWEFLVLHFVIEKYLIIPLCSVSYILLLSSSKSHLRLLRWIYNTNLTEGKIIGFVEFL